MIPKFRVWDKEEKEMIEILEIVNKENKYGTVETKR